MKPLEAEAEAQRLADLSAQALFANDSASRSLGVRIEDVRPGFARLRMTVRTDMLNGHGMCHGGLQHVQCRYRGSGGVDRFSSLGARA
ncbi:MAG: hypothetical protein WBW93_03265 [Steroidobacteraceae bacterium]